MPIDIARAIATAVARATATTIAIAVAIAMATAVAVAKAIAASRAIAVAIAIATTIAIFFFFFSRRRRSQLSLNRVACADLASDSSRRRGREHLKWADQIAIVVLGRGTAGGATIRDEMAAMMISGTRIEDEMNTQSITPPTNWS